jgi:hypothetical protein
MLTQSSYDMIPSFAMGYNPTVDFVDLVYLRPAAVAPARFVLHWTAIVRRPLCEIPAQGFAIAGILSDSR